MTQQQNGMEPQHWVNKMYTVELLFSTKYTIHVWEESSSEVLHAQNVLYISLTNSFKKQISQAV